MIVVEHKELAIHQQDYVHAILDSQEMIVVLLNAQMIVVEIKELVINQLDNVNVTLATLVMIVVIFYVKMIVIAKQTMAFAIIQLGHVTVTRDIQEMIVV